jgi:YidC/Oxa1 family membrane protein insertase
MVLANVLQPLIDIFGPVLVLFHSIIGGSWGWSIIALTVVVRGLLLPLAFKQMHSMQKLQQAAPHMKAILREDICPGLQAAFRHAFAAHHNIPLKDAAGQTVACHALNGSSWLFIHDLTNTATGLTLVVLIVLYVGTQLASSVMMQAPTMDRPQRRMMMLFPLFFVTFVLHFPAGLILYWITTKVWTVGQQLVIRRRIGPGVPVTPVAPAAASRGRGDRRAATTANRDGSSGGGRTSPAT